MGPVIRVYKPPSLLCIIWIVQNMTDSDVERVKSYDKTMHCYSKRHILSYGSSPCSKSMNINHVAGYIITTHCNQAFIRFKSTEVISRL